MSRKEKATRSSLRLRKRLDLNPYQKKATTNLEESSREEETTQLSRCFKGKELAIHQIEES